MPLSAQAKLLRVLETSTLEPVGTSRSVAVDVRAIAATNRDRTEAAEKDGFRQDMYYRLNAVDTEIPTLQQRPGDIPILVSEFLADIAARQRRHVSPVDPAALAALSTHPFPGHVRELIRTLERAVGMARDCVIRLDHPARPSPSRDLRVHRSERLRRPC